MSEPMPETLTNDQSIFHPKRRGRPPKNLQSLNQDENTPTTASSGKERAPRGRKGWEEVVRQQINDIWGIVALGVTIVNPIDAHILTQRAPRITDAIIHLAQVKPAFRKFLLRTSEQALYTELIIAIVPIVVLILVNHKMLPEQVSIPFGGVPRIKTNETNGNSNGNTDDTNAIPFSIFDILSGAMATGGASDNHWADGERENDPSA